MQQFLEKMFTWKYFEPTLFITIGILLLLLFIVFFVGNKDKKSNNNEVEKENNNPAPETAFQDIAPTESVEVSAPVSEVKTDDTVSVVTETPVEDIPPVVSEEKQDQPDFEVFGNNPDFTSSVEEAFNITKEEEKEIEAKEESKEEEIEIPDFKESFNELASSINKELDEISRLSFRSSAYRVSPCRPSPRD